MTIRFSQWIYKFSISVLVLLSLSDNICLSSSSTSNQQNETPYLLDNKSTPKEDEESFSLMLSDEEQTLIAKATGDHHFSSDETQICHYFSGIVYSSPKNWTLWINDKPYSYGSEVPGLNVVKVTSSKINLKSKNAKAKQSKWLTLNNTFCADTGKILSGDQRR